MLTRIQYTDKVDRQAKIDANADKTLIEDDTITEGNFLTFTDIKPVENQVADLQDNSDIMYAQMLMLQGVAVNV